MDSQRFVNTNNTYLLQRNFCNRCNIRHPQAPILAEENVRKENPKGATEEASFSFGPVDLLVVPHAYRQQQQERGEQ